MLPPATFLWLMHCISGLECIAFLVSLRGHCFELQRGLSPATSALVVPAADRVLELIRSGLAGADVTAQLSANVIREVTGQAHKIHWFPKRKAAVDGSAAAWTGLPGQGRPGPSRGMACNLNRTL